MVATSGTPASVTQAVIDPDAIVKFVEAIQQGSRRITRFGDYLCIAHGSCHEVTRERCML